MPPHAEIMCRRADDVASTIPVDIEGEHVGAVGSEVGGVKLPWLGAVAILRLLPPAAGRNHVIAGIAVDVAHAQPVREAKSSGHDLAFFAGHADGMVLP